MATTTDLNSIIDQVSELIRQAAHPRRGTIPLSPEVAAMLDAINPAPTPALTPAPAPTGDAQAGLAALADEVTACTRCDLCNTRKQTVFGDGTAAAKLVFVGEAPGAEEDRQGIPFVGRAGQLLTAIIEKGMGIPRTEVYICNVLKCRPPGNRDPKPAEVQQCEEYLVRQLKQIQPLVICALGGHAAKTLLRTDQSVGRLRGKWHAYHGIPLRVTYHPAYLLRNPEDKRKTWTDVLEVMKVYRGETTP